MYECVWGGRVYMFVCVTVYFCVCLYVCVCICLCVSIYTSPLFRFSLT